MTKPVNQRSTWRRQKDTHSGLVIAGILCFISLCCAVLFLTTHGSAPKSAPKSVSLTEHTFPSILVESSGPRNLVYSYSVIPGGVHSSDELRGAMSHDSVVAELYHDMDLHQVQFQSTKSAQQMYVSYRKDKVYWSRSKHNIPAGEVVATDGKVIARSRCGNLLSLIPQFPVEPTASNVEDKLDTPVAVTNTPVVTPLKSPLNFPVPPGRIVLLPITGGPIGGGGGGGSCDKKNDGDADDCNHHHPPSSVPEPETWFLMITGIVFLVVAGKIKLRRSL